MNDWRRDVPTDAERQAGWRGKFLLHDGRREYEISVGFLGDVPILVVIGQDCGVAKFYGHASHQGMLDRDYWYGDLCLLDDMMGKPGTLPKEVIDQVRVMRDRIGSGNMPRQNPPSRNAN